VIVLVNTHGEMGCATGSNEYVKNMELFKNDLLQNLGANEISSNQKE
jgi:hypothetical protein